MELAWESHLQIALKKATGFPPISSNTSGLGRGGGVVVSISAFYSGDLNLMPAECLTIFLYLNRKKAIINEKEAGMGHL